MAKLYIHDTARVGTLADKQVLDLTAELSNMTIENDLRRKVQDNIKRLRDMGAYRGRRHAMQMPVRGQRTRTQVRDVQGEYPGYLVVRISANLLEQTATAGKLNRVERFG